MAKKPLITTTVTVHGLDNPVVFADAISNGETVRYGTIARQQILNCETVSSKDSTPVDVVIPYHAIIMATVEASEGEFTKPEDDFCKTE